MLLKTTKVCSKCHESKFLSDFYKKSGTKDGLQCWCKDCQNESNKKTQNKKKLQKRNTQLKRFSQYHLTKGLQYKIKGPRTKNSNRQEVVYKCLDCGKEVNSTLDLAWAYKFKCKECFKKGTSTPLFEQKNTKAVKQEKKYDKLNSHKCSCKDCNDNSKDIGNPALTTNAWLNYIRELNNNECHQTVKIVYIPVKEEKQESPKQNRFIKWLKKLFNKH